MRLLWGNRRLKMTLPSEGIHWKDYQIDTPTFELSPIEKPDMSPFLVHMTGKDEIISILKAENIPDEFDQNIPDEYGYLRSNVPSYGDRDGYDAKVICFTESPTFALDFFRHRSFRRWDEDQRFGIGFSKSELTGIGVRPVIYVDNNILSFILGIKDLVKNRPTNTDGNLYECSKSLVTNIYPLLHPLLEHKESQGFIWEREWRYPDEKGFIFPFGSIKIICCPEDEESRIREILGDYGNKITFIRAWIEYEDVTNFLSEQQPRWAGEVEIPEDTSDIQILEQALLHIKGMLTKCNTTLHSLESYENVITNLHAEYQKIEQQKTNLFKRSQELGEALTTVQRLIEKNRNARNA